jgi:DNA-3-methyladenine glycosylase II
MSAGFEPVQKKDRGMIRSFSIKYREPFDFGRALGLIEFYSRDGGTSLHGDRFRKYIRAGSGNDVLVEAEDGSAGDSKIKIRILHSRKPVSAADRSEIKEDLRRMLSCDLDLAEFYGWLKKKQKKLERAFLPEGLGMKPLMTPSLFENICWGIVSQQVNMAFAATLKRRLAVTFGRSLEYDGTRYHAFPRPEDMLGVDIARLRELQLSERKAEYILDLADLVASGELTYERLQEMDDDGIYKRLTAIRGIGPATASWTMIFCLGRYSFVPVNDLGLLKGLHNLLKLKARPTAKEAEKLTAGWHPWGGLITLYIWVIDF